MAVDLLLAPSSSSSSSLSSPPPPAPAARARAAPPLIDTQSGLWAHSKALIEERAWRPFDEARHRRRTREERARAALASEAERDVDDIVTSPVQMEVEVRVVTG